jgi:2-polyprenyl-6-methoxyphenol hydroxylase-like FAD-dependent oxidoreductase
VSSLNNALIVGGGIGGMATAIRLAGAGVAVEIVDIDRDWRVYGAGITITGPTLRAYKRLGLIEAIKRQGAITNGSRIFRYDGVLLHDLDEPPLEDDLPGTGGILRPVLHTIMQERVRALNVPVRLGVTVDALTNSAGGVDVAFSDGTAGRYDVVVGADGIFSRVRDLAFPHMGKTRFTGQGCWRITGSRPPGFDRGEFYFGHKNPAGITACGPDAVYMWLLTEDREHARIPENEMHDRFRAHVADFGGNVAWLRDQMTANTFINYRPLEGAIQPAPWNVGRIALLGDAAHATTPHLASGAGLAVEGALVLAEELERPGRDVAAALAAYAARRYDRCRMVVETSLAVGNLQLAGAAPDEVGGLIGQALHKLAEEY